MGRLSNLPKDNPFVLFKKCRDQKCGNLFTKSKYEASRNFKLNYFQSSNKPLLISINNTCTIIINDTYIPDIYIIDK